MKKPAEKPNKYVFEALLQLERAIHYREDYNVLEAMVEKIKKKAKWKQQLNHSKKSST